MTGVQTFIPFISALAREAKQDPAVKQFDAALEQIGLLSHDDVCAGYENEASYVSDPDSEERWRIFQKKHRPQSIGSVTRKNVLITLWNTVLPRPFGRGDDILQEEKRRTWKSTTKSHIMLWTKNVPKRQKSVIGPMEMKMHGARLVAKLAT